MFSEQCRYCIYARDNDNKDTCKCVVDNENTKEVSLYGVCDKFSDDYGRKYGK